MADDQQQNSSQEVEKTDELLQKLHLNDTAENSNINNDSEQNDGIRDINRKIFIGGIKAETTENDLSVHFSQFGEIDSINVKVDVATGRPRGFAFIVYKTTEGLDNALACTNHIVNEKKIDVKKAIARQVKLFVGGLSPDLTDEDIKDYFNRFAPLVNVEMPFDKVRNQRRGFCFITFDCMPAVSEILKIPNHVINGRQVDVKKALLKAEPFRMMMPIASVPMSGMRGNIRSQGGRGGFPPQFGYVSGVPSYGYGGYVYYNQYNGYSPDYNYSYGYPNYSAGAAVDYQSYSFEANVPRSVQGNLGGKDYQYGSYEPLVPLGDHENSGGKEMAYAKGS